jgi:hypothetical protein
LTIKRLPEKGTGLLKSCRACLTLIVLAACAMLLTGCGKPVPTLAGGKPVNYWLEALGNADPKIRKTAVLKLGNVGASDPSAYPAIVTSLKDVDAGVRREAILALMKGGANGSEPLPELTALQHSDRDARVRDYASKALDYFRKISDSAH